LDFLFTDVFGIACVAHFSEDASVQDGHFVPWEVGLAVETVDILSDNVVNVCSLSSAVIFAATIAAFIARLAGGRGVQN
jgi:hypothetical protein